MNSARKLDPIVLVLLAGLIALARWHTYDEPVDWDLGCYAVFGHEMNLGKSLYKDIWDIKPPAIFVTYALAERITGYGQGEIYLLAVVSSIVTMLGVWRAGGLVAATCFALLSGTLVLDANRPNTEAFINACLAWAIALLVHFSGRRALLRAVGIGVLLGMATLYKQVAIAPALLLMIAHVLSPPTDANRRPPVAHVAIMLATIVGIWLLVAVDFYLTGRGKLFWPTMVSQPRYYGGSTTAALLASLRPSNLFPSVFRPLLPCILLTAAILLKPVDRRKGTILIAAMSGAYLAVALPNKFHTHYYQFWLVPLTIGAGWGARALIQTRRLRHPWLGPAVVTAAVILICTGQVQDYRLPASKWSELNDGTYHTWMLPVGLEIDRMLPPGETFYDFADQGWLYFIARRRPPAVGFGRSQMVGGPISGWLTQQTLEQLKRSPPPLVTAWMFNDPDVDHPVAKWIAANYRPVDDGVNRMPLVLLRRIENAPQ